MSGANGTAYDAREPAALDEGLGAKLPMLRLCRASANRSRRARSAWSPPCTSSSASAQSIARVLVPAFAQGGANVAVVLERG